MAARDSLASFPERGSPPRELLALGINEYRQIVSPPYRIIHYISDRCVIVVPIADGRRDMRSLLALRLLGA
jgi:toxin ParE1/3/4